MEDTPIGVSKRLMKMRLTLTQSRQATIYNSYAPALDQTD